jgi:uncharacterized protein (DUF58 family)
MGRLRTLIDRATDALQPRAVRERLQRLQRKVGLTRTGLAALVASVLMWILAAVVAGTAMYLFAYGAFLLVVLATVLAPRNLKLAGARQGLFPRAREGDRFDVVVTLAARRRVASFVREERVPQRLSTPVRVPVTRLGKGKVLEHHYGLRCSRRGAYLIGPLVAVASDPLGLAQRETLLAEPFELLVHPRVELSDDRPQTRSFEDPPVRPPVSRPWPTGSEFFGMRPYSRGDDLRRVVWRAAARTGQLMVREAEQGITDKVTLVLDTDRGGHSKDGEGLSESFEAGVRAIASLGVKHLRDGYEVRVETNEGPLTRPLRGAGSTTALLDALAVVELGRVPLHECLRRLASQPGRDAHMVVATPHVGALEAGRLKSIIDKGTSVLVLALLWSDESTPTLSIATSLGARVTGLHPGDNLAVVLGRELSGAAR